MRGPSPRAAGTTTVRLLAVGGVALALTGCGDAAASATSSTRSTTPTSPTTPTPPRGSGEAGGSATALAESFSSGALPHGWETAGATVRRGASGPGPAAFVRLTATGTPAYVSPKPRLLAHDRTGFTFTGRFRVTARTPGQTVGLATVENARRTENADLFVDARTGRCRIDLFRDDTALSPGRCDDGRWHTVTLTGDFGPDDPTLAWTLDGRRLPTVHSTGLAPSTVHRLWVGDATPGKTTTTDWTDLRFRLH